MGLRLVYRHLPEQPVGLRQPVVENGRQQVMRQVVAVVAGVDELAPEAVTGHVAGEGEDAPGAQPEVIERRSGA
jgi:hypothetical protein